MNKTKEQIMREVLDKAFGEIEQEEVLECMAIYAKQEAIDYNSWMASFESNKQAKRFFNVKTDDELYNIYLIKKGAN